MSDRIDHAALAAQMETSMSDTCQRRTAEDYIGTLAASASDVPALVAEVRRLRAADEQVRALHHPVDVEPSETICGECSYRMPNGRYLPVVEHPCPTIAALDGG